MFQTIHMLTCMYGHLFFCIIKKKMNTAIESALFCYINVFLMCILYGYFVCVFCMGILYVYFAKIPNIFYTMVATVGGL